MFKKFLKKNVIPITIIALTLVIGISLFFNVSSVYKKKSIVSTNLTKKENPTVTKTEDTTKFTSDGKGCTTRFELLGFNVIQNEDFDGDGKFTFTISSSASSGEFKKFVSESGYTKNSVSYKYSIQRKEDNKWVVKDSGEITIDSSKHTSRFDSKKYSSKYDYRIYIISTNWIRDVECNDPDRTKDSSPDKGYCTCPSGHSLEYKFASEQYFGDSKYKLTQTKYTLTGVEEEDSETDLTPAGQGKDDHVNNYEVNTNCTLPNNSQANQYLLGNTYVYKGTKNNSATFNQYLAEYNAAESSKKAEATLNSDEEVNNVSMALNLTCDYKLDINDIKNVADNDNVAYDSKGMRNYKYDASNTHYFKATKTEKHTVPDYVLHTATGKTISNTNNYCTRTCTEIVKVEYGAPVYVQAGMCFQYRMKVSSIVQCEYDKSHMTKPSKDYNICQPVAYCVHGTHTSVGKGGSTQAGPNEEFEACVNKCDGGKYTSECSNACYNIVYGNQTSTNLPISYTRPTKTASAHGITTFFYYNNGIGFDNGLSPANSLLSAGSTLGNDGSQIGATGYSMKGYTIQHLGSGTYTIIAGIPRAWYGGDWCHESCGWIRGAGCDGSPSDWYFEGDTYNGKYGEKVARADWEANYEKYKNTLNACKAKATCVTSTATYTIKVKYVDTTKDKLQVSEASYPLTPNKKTETKSPATSCALSMDKLNPVISFGGCYVNSEADRWYQGEMTFPGAFLDYKHNKILIKSENKDQEIIYPGRMCIPEAQGNTNAVWAKRFDLAIGQYNKNSSYTINANTYWNNSFSGASYDDDNKSVDGYNIKGQIRDFGYFKWNFNISCFYALYDSSDCPQPNQITCYDDCTQDSKCVNANDAGAVGNCKKVCPPKDSYTIRSYNASDPLATNVSSRESDDVQAREDESVRGWNWTKGATLSKMNSGYNNNPELLIQDIINNQNTVFDDNVNKPNYVIHLDSKTIKEIKKYNRKDGNEYATFNDTNATDPSRVNEGNVKFYYSSKFLHNSEIFGSSLNKIPNNYKNKIYQCNYYVNDECIYLGGGE